LPGGHAELLTAGFLGQQSTLRAVVVPHSAQNLPGHHFAHVHAYQPDDEHPVPSQIVLGELGQYPRLALRRVEGAQLLADVLDLPGPVQRPEQPREEIGEADQRQADVPEPDEQKDLLVEEVNGQRALDDVVVQPRLASNRKLAERDARKPLRLRPILTSQ